MGTGKEYKDSMLRAMFNSPDKALKLYCDITGKSFDNGVKVEMKSLDNILLSKRRNDLSFIINDVLVVILEHQSSLNPNMPLRTLQYILMFYELYYKFGEALYKEKRIKLPKPEFYVLYNGIKPYPATGIQRLSDSFEGLAENEQPSLELIVNVININYHANAEPLERNADLRGYAIFVEKVRYWQEKGEPLKASIRRAADECLEEGILIEFLHKFKGEVDTMFSLVYDEKKAIEVAREEGMEDGIELGLELGRNEGRNEGREEGMEQGRELGFGISAAVIRALQAETPVQEIAEQYRVSVDKIEELQSVLRLYSA